MKKMKKAKVLKSLFPENVTNKEAASLLSVLNTNSHELEEIGGSGLFLLGCLMEHSCRPNCNFSTEGTTLSVVAIQGIRQCHLRFSEARSKS